MPNIEIIEIRIPGKQGPMPPVIDNPDLTVEPEKVATRGNVEANFVARTPKRRFGTVALMLADTATTYAVVTEGDSIEAGGFRYVVAASDASDNHLETAGGVKLYVLPGDSGYNISAFGDVSADAYSALSKAPDGSFVPRGTYALSASIMGKTFWSNGPVVFSGSGHANVIDITEDFVGSLAAVEGGGYPSEVTLYYVSGPSLVATKSGRLIAIYGIGDSNTGGNGTTCPLLYRIYNRATNSWGARKILATKTGFSTRNQLAGVTPTGRIWVAYLQCEYSGGAINTATQGTYYRYSDDDGETWSAEQRLDLYMDYPASTGQVYIPFGKLISFANGNLLITLYRLRMIQTLRSTDNGATWGTPYSGGAIPHPNPNRVQMWTSSNWADDNITEPTIVKIDESRLVAFCRSIPSGLVEDGTARMKFLGRRWTATTRIEADMYCSTAAGRVYKCTVSGTTASVAPSHSSGSAVDGTVTWQYIGTCTTWSSSVYVALNYYVEMWSTYIYIVTKAGTSGLSQPAPNIKFEGNEMQMATIKSTNGGTSWASPEYSTWTSATWNATTSPPRAIVKGGTAYITWFSRSPEWTLYLVKMGAQALAENPKWALNLADNAPRIRIAQSYLSPFASNYDYRVNCGYADLIALPWTDRIMLSWYDCPLLDAVKTTAYSMVIDP